MTVQTLTLPEIKKRLVSSFLSLTLRQILLRTIGFISINLVLARILPIETLGIFNIATGIISFFAFFSDIGLAASLIQKKEAVTSEDIKTTFSIQTLLVGLLSLTLILLAPILGDFYSLNAEGVWLIRVLGFSFFLSSLKVLPSVMLERSLKFKPLVTVELVETIIFNILLIFLAYQQFGIWSFSIAAFARGVVGVFLIYLIAPVKLGFGISKIALKGLLSFGVPFQINSVLALIKDRLVPLVVARMVGPVGIGYVTWSQSMAYLPLEIMNIMIRITFPAFSRLQEDKQSLTKTIEKTLFVTSVGVYPCLFGLAAILPSIVEHVVSSKWQPAVPSFYLFFFSAFWAVISTTFTNALNAIGKIKTTLKLMVFWTVTTWILTPILVHFYGFIGVGISSFIISFTSVITIFLLKKVVQVRVWDCIKLSLTASTIMAISMFWIASALVRDKPTLFLSVFIGALIYTSLILLFGKERLIKDLKTLRNG
ncbi:MAG: Polysaccharide biosynthesis protein [Candidatus Daviesbacteria bacterium GW2011_GWA2_38_24]|uniref:Polysaccharide biosynthesis protein n=1 Tax=Candidatus Daviesbacteria bacterium GW2011_GWA2_38_24 TaxID=1618422 RepID=A0A0G0M0U6_9BACT|nr:MAG: Polysaccharide biosynthesis protein [Candidatus Daviesbacteria bacterium GW2011_GWA2_38_24]KKQ80916.1 MAG: Polysaccharide biosynthesis protein [Candidatus Daviesbacteria bacterium GW2011_GWA1_38_7]OGE24026.1 MAG: hypothetical protein A2688_01950 [Candidatus Daviesbacteria bacterium RIFCSPHIGHO2_01_FULL_38_8]